MDKTSFFDQIDATSIAEQNIKRLLGLEMLEAKRFAELYKRVLDDLRKELNSLESENKSLFSQTKLKILIRRLEDSLKILEGQYKKEMLDATEILIRQSSNDALEEYQTFEQKFGGITRQPIPFDAIRISLRRTTFLINRFASSLDEYNAKIKADVQRKLSESIVKRETYQEAKDSLAEGLLEIGFQDWKIARIARTELHNIYNSSKLLSMNKLKDKFVPKLKKSVIIPIDARTAEDSMKLKKLNLIIDIDKPFKYTWNRRERVFHAPPDRPNDRSILIPVKEDWLKS